MGQKEQIIDELPKLRRFAHAVAGATGLGDETLEKALKAYISNSAIRLSFSDPKLALFVSLAAALKNLDLKLEEKSDSRPNWGRIQKIFFNLDIMQRMAFFLKAVEGFSLSDIAIILGSTKEKVEDLLAEGSSIIADTLKTDVLIIEDNPFIALDLQSIVKSLGHSLIGIAQTNAEALELIKVKKPGLVLSDIELADGSSGIETVNDLLEEINVPVIFITGYPERYLNGDKCEPAFLVPKPFLPETIRALISQALFFDRKAFGHGLKIKTPDVKNSYESQN